jgi:hypothetical protein
MKPKDIIEKEKIVERIADIKNAVLGRKFWPPLKTI